MKTFYSHLIEIESIIVSLDELDLNQEQKIHLAKLVDSSLHHKIMDAVLSELSDEDKKVFVEHLSHNSHDKIWRLLNEKIDKIEDKIKTAAEQLKDELKKDLKEAKKIKP